MRIIEYDCIDSSSCEAQRLLSSKRLEPPFAVLATHQTQGRGQRGKSWVSLPGNLFLSLCERVSPQSAKLLSLRAGVILVSVLADFVNAKLELKWPNDVLAKRCKLAGILCEVYWRAGGDSCDAVVGIGVNITQAPTGLDQKTTSLAALKGEQVHPRTLADSIVAGWRDIPDFEVLAEYRRLHLPSSIPWSSRLTPEHEYRFVAIDDTGGLVLKNTHNGRHVSYTSSEPDLYPKL